MLKFKICLKAFIQQYLVVLFCFATITCFPQTTSLTLNTAFEIAERNYPVNGQKNLIEQSEHLNIKNLNTGYWPMLSINGQGSYQSDVTAFNISIPGIKIPTQSKDQYKAYGDLSQLVYDGGFITEQKKILLKNSDVEKSKVDVELNNLKTRKRFYKLCRNHPL